MKPAHLVALIIVLVGERHTGPRAGVGACPAAGGAMRRAMAAASGALQRHLRWSVANVSLAGTTCSTGAGCRRFVRGGRHRRQGQGLHQFLRVRGRLTLQLPAPSLPKRSLPAPVTILGLIPPLYHMCLSTCSESLCPDCRNFTATLDR